MRGLTLTIVTPKIQSVNYGETIGNVSTLKKLSTGTDNPKKLITYFSDKAIKYDVKRIGREQCGWRLIDGSIAGFFDDNSLKHSVLTKETKKTKKSKTLEAEYDHVGFLKNLIKNFEEFDLFGGMFADIGKIFESKGDKKKKIINVDMGGKTYAVKVDAEKLKRSQPVRFSNGYSISEFVYDMNLLNDIDAYNRYIQRTAGKKQSLVYPEEHFSYYTYTLTIDLDKVGAYEKEEDGRVIFEPIVDPDVRAKRVNNILEIVLLYLNRKIKGRDERLTPIFLIGGVYNVKHPFFANAIYFSEQNQKLCFNADDIKKIFDTYQTLDISKDTFLHFHDSFVEAKGQVPTQLENKNLQEILKAMTQKICDYYSEDKKQK